MILTEALMLTLLLVLAVATDGEPMVAFSCGYGTMRSDMNGGWTADQLTNCLLDKDDILSYCKKSYPNLDVTNIVENADKVHVAGWCPVGPKTSCKQPRSFKVQPYRCLTGPYQSDTLVVPKTCIFDHIHESETCSDFAYWKRRAHGACHTHSTPSAVSRTRSYAMLLPCAVDKFTGVEFVCCPENMTTTKPTTVRPATSDPMTSDPTTSGPESSADSGSEEDKSNSDVRKYIIMPESLYRKKEHSLYKTAKAKLIERNQQKLARLMEDWGKVKKRVEEMRKTDPKGADILDSEVTPRFQREYFSVQTNSDSLLLQLDTTHQQHVQAVLTEKKRLLASQLMAEIQSEQFHAKQLLSVMKKYIEVEHKDAQHCVQHYVKVRSHDPTAAAAMLSVTLDHLKLIQTRMSQAIDLLDTLEDRKLGAALKDQINSWRAGHFTDLGRTISGLSRQAQSTSAPEMKPIPRKSIEKIFIPTDVKLNKLGKLEVGPEYEIPPRVSDAAPQTETPEKSDQEVPRVKVAVVHKSVYQGKLLSVAGKLASYDADLDMIDPVVTGKPILLLPDMKNQPVPNKMKRVSLNARHNAVESMAGHSVSAAGVIGIILAAVAGTLVVFAVVVVVINRRRAANYQKVASIEEQYAYLTAEERCIAAMQNGFENPTYKLLERNRKI